MTLDMNKLNSLKTPAEREAYLLEIAKTQAAELASQNSGITVTADGLLSISVKPNARPKTMYAKTWVDFMDFFKSPADHPLRKFIAENTAKLAVWTPDAKKPAGTRVVLS